MRSCIGNQWLKRPAMDYIAEKGIRFTRAYTTNPVCSPARVSLRTGRFAGALSDSNGNQVRENSDSMRIPQISDEVKNSTVAAFMKQAGYELVFGDNGYISKTLFEQLFIDGVHLITKFWHFEIMSTHLNLDKFINTPLFI